MASGKWQIRDKIFHDYTLKRHHLPLATCHLPFFCLRLFGYILFTLFVSVLGMTPGLLPLIYGARPLLALPLTVCVAMVTGPGGGALTGFAAGLIWDAYSLDRPAGYHALLLMLLGCIIGLSVRLRLHSNLPVAMFLMTGAMAVTGGLDRLFGPGGGNWMTVLYTLAVTPAVYGIARLISRIGKPET